MKLIKLFFMFTIVSMIVISCKETKKEGVQDADAVEMTEESSSESENKDVAEEGADESTAEGEGSSSESTDAAAAGSKEPATGVESASKDIEELKVPEGVLAEELADTPVIYPGCAGSAEEVRACNRESFIAFIKSEFNKNLAPNLNLGEGDYEIKSIIHIDGSGKISTLKVVAPHKALEAEMVRVIGKAPKVTPAIKAGEPVAISFVLPVNFKVQM